MTKIIHRRDAEVAKGKTRTAKQILGVNRLKEKRKNKKRDSSPPRRPADQNDNFKRQGGKMEKEKSELSEVSQVSQVSEVSEVSQVSEVSEVSQVSEVSEEKTKQYPFEIRGQLGCTPEQAERMFGFKMKEGATGIIFTKRPDGKIVIRNKMPQMPFQGIPQKNKETVFSVVGRIASEHLKDIVRPIWNAPGKEMGMSGQNLFIRENMKVLEERMKKEKLTHKKHINTATVTEWENLKVATGKLQKPIIKIAEYYFSTGKRLKFIIKNPQKYDVGICLLDRHTFELTHIAPQSYEYPIRLHLEKTVHRPAVYLYFTNGTEWSESSGVVPRSKKG